MYGDYNNYCDYSSIILRFSSFLDHLVLGFSTYMYDKVTPVSTNVILKDLFAYNCLIPAASQHHTNVHVIFRYLLL